MMPGRAEIRLNVKVLCNVMRVADSDVWIGECDALGVIVEGKSLDDVQTATDEALSLLFEDLLEDNELDDFLRDRGWALIDPVPDLEEATARHIRVPVEMVDKGTVDGFERCVA